MHITDTTARTDRAIHLEPSSFEADGGELIGRDPRALDADALAALGATSPIKAIRAKCIDCSGGSVGEARKCVAKNCPLWPFRMGKNVLWGKGTRKAVPEHQPAEIPGFLNSRAIRKGRAA